MMNLDRNMKLKPYEALNTKFSEYQKSLLISYATFELLEFENRTDVIIEISRFLRHRCPVINEGVFAYAGSSIPWDVVIPIGPSTFAQKQRRR